MWQNFGGQNIGECMLTTWQITSVLYLKYLKGKLWLSKILLPLVKFVNILPLYYYAMYGIK